jgi:hypothetical protein
LINPYVFGAFFLVYLATSLSAYLYSTKRLGQRVSDVMLKKEAVLLGQGWPGYLHADFWGLLGPSGRLGATTTKGVGGREALVSKYALPSMLAGFASLAGAVTGVWLLGNTIFYLGAAAAFGGPGIGIALCTFWALYHAGMIFRGFGISQSLNTNFAQEHFDRLKSEVEIRDSDGRGTRFLRRRLKTLEDILLTFRGIGFSINKTLIEDQLNALYAPKSLHKKLDDRIIPSAIRENIRGWRRLNPLIFSGKVLYGLLGMFRRPEKW